MNKIISLLGIMLVISGFALSNVSAHEGADEFGHHGMMSGFYGGGVYGGMWMFGWIFMVLILVALVLFIVWLVNQLQDTGRGKRRRHRRR